MQSLAYCAGFILLLLFIYIASRLAGLGWYTSMKEVIKSKTKKGA